MSGLNLREIFRLPKWAKISLMTLSAVAIVLLVGAFALQKWADSQVESANLVLTKIDKNKSAELSGESNILGESRGESQIYAYEARVYFKRLDFLLRSRTISNIDLQSIAWVNGIDSSAIQSIETHNRRLNFTTTQNLALDSLDSGVNLGVMSFKMDFSPFVSTIAKYALTIITLFLGAILLYRVIALSESGKISFGEISLPQALWQSYKNINPLYRHTFWIVFIACNVVFGFHTVQYLWGGESWGATYDKIGGNWVVYQGRYTQNAIAPYLTQDLVLPILNNLLAFFAISIASILLCIYLNIQRKVWIWVIIGFTLTLQPFTLAKMYFTYQVVGLFIAVAIGILGFILAKKAGESSTNRVNLAQVGGGQLSRYA